MTDTLRVGIIGAGNMGGRHARHWSRLPGARVAAVADVQAEKAERLAAHVAEASGGAAPRVFADGAALIADGGVDAVSICLPTPLHRPPAEAAFAAGKHVLCEKPMALTLADCDAMIEAAGRSGVVFTVGQVVRFFPEYARAKALVDGGAVGTPAAVRVRRVGDFRRMDTDWYADPEQGGGVLFDLLVHDFDWLLWCFGPVTRVYAKGRIEQMMARSIDHLDYALVTLRHASGVTSHAEGTWADPGGFATSFEIAGDGGLLEHDSRKGVTLRRALRQSGEPGARGIAVPESPLAPEDDPYYRQIEAFVQVIRTGAPTVVRPEEARAAVAVAVAARESVRTGEAVPLG